MSNPNANPNEPTDEQGSAQEEDSRLEDILMLISNGPMCFECLEEANNEKEELPGEQERD